MLVQRRRVKKYEARGKIHGLQRKGIGSGRFAFIRKGYEETTMQDIMEESGLSKGAIYHHFAGKQEILSTMIADAQMKVNTFFQEMEENAEMTVKEKISRIIRYFFDNKNQSMLIRNRWVEKVPYALVDTVRNGNAFIAPRVAGIIKQGNENGEFRCDFPEELAEALLLLLDVWLDPVITDRTADEICRRLEFIFRLLESFGTQLFGPEDMEAMKRMYAGYAAEGDMKNGRN